MSGKPIKQEKFHRDMAVFVLKILMLRATMIVIALSVIVSYVVLLTRGLYNRSKPRCRHRVRLGGQSLALKDGVSTPTMVR